MSHVDLPQTEALVISPSPTATVEDLEVSAYQNTFTGSPPCTVVQVHEHLVSDPSTTKPSRRTKASRWRTLHKNAGCSQPLVVAPSTSSANVKYVRQRWYGKFKRDSTSATNVSHVDITDLGNSAEQRRMARVRSFRKLQRGAVVVQSDNNSRASAGSGGSKNYSLDSTKSDGLLNKTISLTGDAPLDHFLPSLTLTVPAEDILPPATHASGGSSTQYTTSLEQEDSATGARLCDYCTLLQPTISTGPLCPHNTLSPCIVRRHSHCGCSSDGDLCNNRLSTDSTNVGTANINKDNNKELLCARCQRPSLRQTPCLRTYASRNIYPPTRNRNASCSGIDMLADAILQARSKEKDLHPHGFDRHGRRPSSITNFPTFLTCGGGKAANVECKTNNSRDLLNFGRFRLTRRGEGRLRRPFLREKPQNQTQQQVHQTVGENVPDGGSISTSAVNPPVVVTPSTELETTKTASTNKIVNIPEIRHSTALKAKTTDRPMFVRSADYMPIRAKCELLNGMHFLKTHSIDSCAENSLKVPTLGQLLPKRTLPLEDEIPLDSRIRRVSMILLSRQHPTLTEHSSNGTDIRDAPSSVSVSKEEHPLLVVPTVKTPVPRTCILSSRQDTDNWSLTSTARIDSPKLTSHQFLSTGKPVGPIAPTGSLSPSVTLDTGSPTRVRLLSPAIDAEVEDAKSEAQVRYRRLRRPTERYSKGIGYHLGRRRHLLERRRRMADFSLAFGLFGIVAAFLDTELIARSLYSKTSVYSYGVRFLISLSTLVLLALIISYHAYDIMIFLCEEYIKDWRISVTRRRVIQVLTELLVCSIHPVPGIDLFFHKPHPVRLPPHPTRYYSHLDDTFSPYLLLILPMIGRFYLAFRALLLHSKMFNDAGSRSIGAMNKVSFDLRFVLKTLMTLCPVKTLLVFIVSLWLILSWTLRACELEQGEHHLGLLNSAWLISVTFLSIGYGDIVPHTSCGRLVAVSTGLMGSACTALLVAVFSRKLEMSKAEKHVLHFMEANKITKRVKHCAANVLRETWLLYKHAKLMPSFNPNGVRVHQRKFLRAIYSLRSIKVKQREMQDKSDSLVDLAKLQTNVFESVADISLRQDMFQNQLTSIEQHLVELRKLMLQQRSSQPPE